MKKKMVMTLVLCCLAGSLAACRGKGTESSPSEAAETSAEGQSQEAGENTDGEIAEGTGEAADSSSPFSDDEMFTDRDYETDYDDVAAEISLDETGASCQGDGVEISGQAITITEEGTYLFSGALEDGYIIVDAPDTAKVHLVLNGVSINSGTSAPIYVSQAEKVFLTLAEGTENTLSNGGTFESQVDESIDSVIFSKQDLTLNGAGSLTVASPAGHGIRSNDDLVITGGSYTISCADHGLKANDSIRITGSTTLNIRSGKDGIHSEHDSDVSLGFVYISGGGFDIEADGDGISASGMLQIEDGTFNLVTGGGSENGSHSGAEADRGFGGPGRGGGRQGEAPAEPLMDEPSAETSAAAEEIPEEPYGETAAAAAEEETTSMKGLKATGNLLINAGTFSIDSADDSIHSNASVSINGGTFELSTGDDGIHGDDTLTINAGNILIRESYEGLEALHVDIQGGNIQLTATDDGINAAGESEESGSPGAPAGKEAAAPLSKDGEGQRPGVPLESGEASNPPERNGGEQENSEGTGSETMPQGRSGGGRGGRGGGPGGMGMGSGRGTGGDSSASNGTISISGGTVVIHASGDGMDANGSLTISGGLVTIVGPTRGDTSILDYDTTAAISGGTFIGTGASGMGQTFGDSEQAVVTLRLEEQAAGTEVSLQDSDGNVLISTVPDQSFSMIIFSSPDLNAGETYQVTAGETVFEVMAQ
ncbi:MAG TPA: carbohydrate-binding domain-containing protein [Candidatus Enterocloster excrementigallinarum]|uniref:Carbohydrate-binding domain-containing protein n=1 Tax=Candidatus Enterocloster excrementigallinarum TaxID=2838558 RepID=A0A9D2PVN7_9FIRM|nr:carbohydrate-binding domain-containing protein [Candidatus Enterocloster excrementigallinarum]